MKRLCPYVEKSTIVKTLIFYNDEAQEKGSIQTMERQLLECDGSCMMYKKGKCTYKGEIR